MIPIYRPYLTEKTISYCKEALESGWISSIGEYIEKATEKLKNKIGCKYVLLVNNGTAATHLCVKALKKRYPKTKKVFVPSSCYVAAYNALLYDQNDWTIEAIDIDIDTWNMNIPDYKENDAIMAVHNLGNIINLKDVSCPVIEDSCEAIFATVKQQKSLCSSLSFFGNKNITTGEGGAVITDDEEVFRFLSKVAGQGQTKKRYIHDELGYNYRMTNIQAAMLLGQLEDYELIQNKKRNIFTTYDNLLDGINGVLKQKIEIDHSFWMYGVRILGSESYEYNNRFFSEYNIETRPMFYPFTKHSHLKIKGEHKNIDLIHKDIVLLPSYPELKQIDIEYICDKIKKIKGL